MATQLKQALPQLGSSIMLVTPELARHWRLTAHFERQRNIAETNVARLASEMAAGRFTPGTQIYFCVLPDQREVLVNGNHTLEAIAASEVPQLLTVTRKAVADEDEAGRIYAVFDIQKVRSWRDSLRAVGKYNDLPQPDKYLSAVTVIANNFAHGSGKTAPVGRVERIELLEDYREPIETLHACYENSGREARRLLFRAGITAVALETIRYQPTRATEFWYDVAHDEGLTTGRPEKALLQWLRNWVPTNGGMGVQREAARAAALAWNAAFRCEERQVIKPNALGNFFLLGTPWAKGLNQ